MIKWTPKQKLAIANYEGNLTDACRKAGYAHARVAASRLLTNVAFAAEISAIDDGKRNAAIMSRQARKEWLTKVVQNGNKTMTARLKAVELLCKMEGDFVEHRIIEDKRRKHPSFWEIAVECSKVEFTGEVPQVGSGPGRICDGGFPVAEGEETIDAADDGPESG